MKFEIGLCLVVIALILTLGFNTAVDNMNSIEYAKAGLEECRVDANTIWVKDCKTILETKARLK